MSDKKNLLINCDVCDTRSMQEEDYASYEKIIINTDFLLVGQRSKSILNRLPFTINHDSTIELPDGEPARLKTVNGSYRMGAGNAELPNTFLLINGSLFIEPDAGEVLRNFARIAVNGSVRYPESLEGLLTNMTVNGSSVAYPADCTLLDRVFTLDAYFPLRAKQDGKYFAEKRVTISDPAVDLSKLVEKHVTIRTKTLLTLARHVEAAAEIFDEHAQFIVVPNDMTLIDDDVTLDETLLKKRGKRLFVYGNVTLGEGFASVEKLIVRGTVKLKKKQLDAFRELDAEYDKLQLLHDGRILQNAIHVKIDQKLLDHSPEGIWVENVAKVTIDPAVTPEAILEKLHIENCAKVACTEDQESSVVAISENVAKIGEQEDEDDSPLALFKKAINTKVINADSYIL